jgi:subtilisin family serine protease
MKCWGTIASLRLGLIFIVLAMGLPVSSLEANNVNFSEAGVAFPAPKQIDSWGINRIGLNEVPEQIRGKGVKVAVLDTGIDLDHPDLKVAGNVSFVTGAKTGDDDNGHGTLVGGIIAARDNEIGARGIAPEVELYAVKVLDKDGNGTSQSVKKGIEWCIDNDIQVINMSFGTLKSLPADVRQSLKKAYEAGIVIIAAAGNEGAASTDKSDIWAPACYEGVIAVGAVDESYCRVDTSSTGEQLELTAPGERIYSTFRGGGYAYLSMTSAAAPHVSGVAALLVSCGVTSNEAIRNVLDASAEDAGSEGKDSEYGYGIVNAAGAVDLALD